MNVVDTADTAVLLGPESEADTEVASTLLTAFNRTDGLVSYRLPAEDYDTEHDALVLARRNDYDVDGSPCGGCGGSGGGLLSWLARTLTDLVYYVVLGAGIGALLALAEQELPRLVAAARSLLSGP